MLEILYQQDHRNTWVKLNVIKGFWIQGTGLDEYLENTRQAREPGA